MATVHVVVGYSKGRGVGGAALPILASQPSQVDTVTSSSTSAQATPVVTQAEVNDGALWSITTTGDIYVRFGSNPTAVADQGYLITAGSTREFSALVDEKVAIKDA